MPAQPPFFTPTRMPSAPSRDAMISLTRAAAASVSVKTEKRPIFHLFRCYAGLQLENHPICSKQYAFLRGCHVFTIVSVVTSLLQDTKSGAQPQRACIPWCSANKELLEEEKRMSIERMKPLILAGVAGVFSTLVLMSGVQAQEAPKKAAPAQTQAQTQKQEK